MARISPSSNAKPKPRGPSASGSSGGSSWGSSFIHDVATANVGGLVHDAVHNPLLQFQANLAKDVGDAALGLVPGLIESVKHPIASVKLMGKGMWADWSPLFHGDVGKWGKNFYDHPLGPILDVASVLTLGAGGAARGAKMLSAAGVEGRVVKALAEPELIRPLASGHDVAETGAVATHAKMYNANPIIRARQLTLEKAVNGLASLSVDWFKADPAISKTTLSAMSRAERGDAWRWYRADKYDAASRAHAVQASNQMAIAGIMSAAHRMATDPVAEAHKFMPHIVDQLETHAYRMPESDFPGQLYRPTSKGGQIQVNAQGVAQRVKPVKNPKTISSDLTFVHKDARQRIDAFLAANPNLKPQELADFIAGKDKYAKGGGLSGRLVTNDWRKAARDSNGDFLVARNHAKYFAEAANSTHFLAQVGRKFTTMWKFAVLGIRPGFFVNNAVGNYAMYLVSRGPDGLRGFVDAWRQLKPQNSVIADMSKAERQFFRSSFDWQDKYYLGLHQGFGKELTGYGNEPSKVVKINLDRNVKARLVHTTGHGLYDLTHTVTDKLVRRAAINDILRANPEVQKLMKGGMHFDEAAATVSENRLLRESVQQQVNDILGQYHYLNPAERAIRAVVPFYTWDRAIARHGAHIFMDKPVTAEVLTRVGQQGDETVQALLGDMPDFLKGALPLSMVGLPSQTPDGRVPILGTTGLNPYASLTDVLKTGQALVSGQAPAGEVFASQMNPAITAALEQATNTNLLTGKPLPKSQQNMGLIEAMLGGTIAGLPQTSLEESARGKKYSSPDTLYRNDFLQYLMAYLGAPTKALNVEAAQKLAKERG